MKKIIALLLVLSLAVPSMSMQTVKAQENMSSYLKTEDGWYYMDNDSCVTIAGYDGDVEELVIPSTIDGKKVDIIYEEAFAELGNLKKVTIPATVERIRAGAFRDCTALETVTYMEPVNEERSRFALEASVFENCTSLEKVTFPSDIYDIGDEAFRGCGHINEVTIPASVGEYIGNYIFAACTGLQKVTIENNMTELPKGMFSGCSALTEIKLPDSVTTIGKEAFMSCSSLAEIKLPDSVILIEESAYEDCTGLSNLLLPDSVIYIRSRAFSGCTGFQEIQMSENIDQIGSRAFEDCTKLEKIVLPYGFTSILDKAFMGCSNLSDVYLPETVEDIYEDAFTGCSGNLTIHTTEAADSVINYAKYEQTPEIPLAYDYNAEYTQPIYQVAGDWKYYLREDGTAAICGYTGNATDIVIPSVIGEENIPVREIGDYAFLGVYDIRERTVIIPSGVTEIGVSAFNTCLGLYDIIIPDSVVTIHGTAFAGTSWVTIHGGVGSAAIRYAQEKGMKYAISVTGISFASKTIQLKKGDSAYLEVTVMPEAATNQDVVWSTSNENIVTVDDGYIEGIAAGTATITATATDGSGVYAQCQVTVTEPYIVKFNANGGTKLSKSSITIATPNAKIGTLPTVIRNGYSFKGWYTAKTGGTKITSSTKISKSMTLYAQWSKINAPGKGNTPTLKSEKSGQITVSFKKVSKAKGYKIVYSTSKKFTKATTKSTTVSGTSKTLTKLIPGKTYYVKVCAYVLDGAKNKVYGKYSATKNITLAPKKVSTTTLKSKKSGQVTVSFEKVSNAKGYQITYSTSKKFKKSTTKTVTVAKNTATLKNLKKGKSYYVKVRAYTTDSSGKKVYGAYSTAKNVKVKK